MNRKLLLLPVVIVFYLGSCTMAPKYERPDAPVPAQWPTVAAYDETKSGTSAKSAVELSWREFITDQRLREVIETALKNNRDLRVAAVRTAVS